MCGADFAGLFAPGSFEGEVSPERLSACSRFLKENTVYAIFYSFWFVVQIYKQICTCASEFGTRDLIFDFFLYNFTHQPAISPLRAEFFLAFGYF